MAGVNVNAWIPIQYGGPLFKKFTEASVLFRVTGGGGGRTEQMTSRTKTVPKEGDVAVQFTAKGATYGLDNGTVGTIDLVAKKMTGAVALDDEDIKDTAGFVNTVQAKRDGAVRGFARLLDNAAFAVTGTPTAEPDMSAPYDSLYRQVTNYLGGANIQTWDRSSGTAAELRAAVLETIDIAENSDWATDDLVVLANQSFRQYLRNQTIDGSNGLPIWSTAENTIMNHSVQWGRGLRKTAVATQNPTGNPLMIVGPPSLIVAGIREQLAWRVTDAQTGIGALSDTSYVLASQRTGFNIGDASAFGILELVP